MEGGASQERNVGMSIKVLNGYRLKWRWLVLNIVISEEKYSGILCCRKISVCIHQVQNIYQLLTLTVSFAVIVVA